MDRNADTLLQLATQRKTVRKFKPDVPPAEDIQRVLATACQAPSGSNAQPWSVVIIDDPLVKADVRKAAEEGEKNFYANISEKRRDAYRAMGNSWKKEMLEEAPVLLAIVSDSSAPNFRPSVWLFIGYLVLAFEAAGIGSVTYTPSGAGKVARVLEIPDGYRLEAILPIGYSNDAKKKGVRKGVKEVAYRNQWNNPQSF